LAVLIFRFVENLRKRPEDDKPPEFLPYASHYIAMVVGEIFLHSHNKGIADVNHRNFKELTVSFEEKKRDLYKLAITMISAALKNLYGERIISLQQLSATFRRGDLLEYIDTKRVSV